MKTIVVMMLLAVLGALASAGVFMLRRGKPRDGTDAGDGHGVRSQMARALALRVALSVAVFVFILFGWWMGWVRPGGIPVG